MAERSELVSYAMDFASYLVLKTKGIDRIILFGSIARDDFDEESDVDLFVDTKESIKKRVNSILEDYNKTKKFKEWDLKGIKNSFSIISGDLNSDEWRDLRRGIANDGIVLYGKFSIGAENTKQYVLFSFENIKPDKKRVSVFRKLFGFKVGKKEYKGMVEKLQGIRIGKGSLLIPISKVNEFKRYFREKKINVKVYDVWSDARF